MAMINNDWATPQGFYDEVSDAVGGFSTFDPCPYDNDFNQFDGLDYSVKWPNNVFVNPPYDLKNKTEFVERALGELIVSGLCKHVYILLPVSTSTKLFHKYIYPNASEILFLSYRLKFEGINDKNEHVNPRTGINQHLIKDKFKGCVRQVTQGGKFDSMLVHLVKPSRAVHAPKILTNIDQLERY